jgi:hypothetical protein
MTEIDRLMELANDFMKVHNTDSAVIIVSQETFAKIMHHLKDVKFDKNYAKGKLGVHTVKSDGFVKDDSVVLWWPPEEVDFKPGCFLPALTDPEVEKMRKHMENAKKKELNNV